MCQKKGSPPVCVVLGDARGECFQVLDYFGSKGFSIAFMGVQKELGLRVKGYLEEKYNVAVFFFHGDAESEPDMEYFAGGIGGMFQRVDYFVNYACIHPCLGKKHCCVEHMTMALRDGVAKPFLMVKQLSDYFSEDSYIFNLANAYCYHGPEGLRTCTCPVQKGLDSVLDSIRDYLGDRVKVYGIGHDEKEYTKETGSKLVSMIQYLSSPEGLYMNGHMIELDELTSFMFYNGEKESGKSCN